MSSLTPICEYVLIFNFLILITKQLETEAFIQIIIFAASATIFRFFLQSTVCTIAATEFWPSLVIPLT
jgi:hypothetical protein